MPTVDADSTSQLLYAGDGPYLIVNLSTTVTVYLSQAQTVYTTDTPLPPQASVQLDGPYNVSTCEGGVVAEIGVLPGSAGGYSNPVGVQLALSALGLATAANQETTQNTLISGIGLPTGAAEEAGNLATLLGQAQTGIAPYVPGLKGAFADGIQFVNWVFLSNLQTAIRVWAVWVSASAIAETGYTTGASSIPVLVSVQIPSLGETVTLAETQLLVYTAGNQDRGDVFLPLHGFEVPGTPTQPSQIELSVNNATAVSGVGIRAAAGVLYTQP